MKPFNPKNRIFLKYLISNLAIFLIPFVLLGPLTFNLAVKQLTSEIDKSRQSKITLMSEELDKSIATMRNIAFTISMDQAFSPAKLNSGALREREAIQRLKQFLEYSFISSDLMIYFREDLEIYSAKGKLSNDMYFSVQQKVANGKELIKQINESKAPFFYSMQALPGENMDQAVYVYPVAIGGGIRTNAAVIFWLNSDLLSERISNVSGEFSGDLIWLNGVGKEIMSIRNTHGTYSDKKTSVSTQPSMESDAKYVIRISSPELLNNAQNLQYLFNLFLASLFMVGVLAAVFFARRHYKPVRTMHHSIGALTAKVDDMKIYMKQNFFLSLLRGNVSEISEEELKAIDLHLPSGYYSVIALFPGNAERFSIDFKPELSADHIHMVDLTQEGYFIFIIHLKSSSEDELHREVVSILNQIKHMDEKVFLGVGHIYENLLDIKYSFIEAMSALDFKQRAGHEEILHFHQVSQQFSDYYWYPSEPLMRLTQAVKQGDHELAVEMLSQLKERIQERKLSFLNERLICYDAINELMKSVNDLKLKIKIADFNTFVSTEQLTELFPKLEQFIVSLCESVSMNRKLQKDSLIQAILKYVQDHYDEYAISLELVAEQFGFSVNALSKFFKEEIGIGFKEYVIELRMNKAKHLLDVTDLNVGEITHKIGYMNVSHFIKTFKKHEGITPNQYTLRKQTEHN